MKKILAITQYPKLDIILKYAEAVGRDSNNDEFSLESLLNTRDFLKQNHISQIVEYGLKKLVLNFS